MLASSSTHTDTGEARKGFDRLGRLAQPSMIAARSERREIAKMANLVSDMMYAEVRAWSEAAGEDAAMQVYSGDGTPVRTTKRRTVRLFGKQAKRSGKNTNEYFIQTAFFRFIDATGAHHSQMMFAPPLALTKGLGADAQYSAGVRFSQTLRERGHRGLCLNLYTFDRKGIDRLARFYFQRHTEAEGKWGEDEADSWLLGLLEWTLVVPCALHDLHNALKWSIGWVFHDAGLIKDTWVIFASVRNSFDDITHHICLWLLQHVAFKDENELPPVEELASFWRALGVDEEKVHAFAHELRLCWDPDKKLLMVSSAWAGNGENVLETLSGIFLFFLEAKSFAESRWASVQGNAQFMMCLTSMGFRRLVAFVQDQPNMLKEHLGGFSRLDAKQIRFLIHCMFAGRVVDRALLLLMKDNRLALIADKVEEAMQEEVDKVEGMERVVWERLAALSEDGTTGFDLRSSVIKACHVCCCFFQWRALNSVKQLPFSLGRGDQDANLDELLAGPEPAEQVSLKIWKVLKKKLVSRKLIKKALQLLLETPWTTLTAEQGHACLSVIRKCREELGAEQACLRAFLAFCNKCTPKMSVLEQKQATLVKQLSVLNRKNPNMARPSNFYFRDLVSLSHEWEAAGRWRHKAEATGRGSKIMRGQSGLFDQLSDGRKSHYEQRARSHIQSRHEALAQNKADMIERKHTITLEVEEERKQMPCLKIASARYTARSEQWIEERYQQFAYSEKNVSAWVARVLTAPEAPGGPEPPKVGDKIEGAVRPPWFMQVCARRTAFEQCGFVFGHGVGSTYYKFMFARQANPVLIYFQPMSRMPELTLGALAAVGEDHEWWQWRFHSERAQYSQWDQIEGIQLGEATSILTDMAHVSGRHAATDIREAVPIETFIASLPPLEVEVKEAEEKAGSSQGPGALKDCPWMTKPLAGIGFVNPPSGREQEAEYIDILEQALKEKMTEDDLDELHHNLELKRREWEDQGIGLPGGPFRLSMRKGKFTYELTGQAFNSCMAAASGGDVHSFCDRYGLPNASRYATKLFTEQGAIQMAKAWRAKMTHFYSMYLEQHDEMFVFSRAHIDSFVEDEHFTRYVETFTDGQMLERLMELRDLAPM